jgi:hypothetical protein
MANAMIFKSNQALAMDAFLFMEGDGGSRETITVLTCDEYVTIVRANQDRCFVHVHSPHVFP